MPSLILKPEQEQQAYVVKFHVRVPARWDRDTLEQRLRWSLERMIGRLGKQGWTFLRLSEQPPRGPLPVVPIKGFPRRPPGGNKGTPLGRKEHDDALWRVSTLPTFGPKAPHLMTDEVDWEYSAIFSRSAITTEFLEVAPEEGAPEPLWLLRKR